MIINRTVAAIAAALMLAGASAAAHHAFSAEFDQDKPVNLEGTLTKAEWMNPHAWIYLDVTGEDGKVVSWSLEMTGANGLIRRGWRREDLPAGTVLVVEGWQARNGTPTADIATVTFEDGRTLFAGSSNPAARQQ